MTWRGAKDQAIPMQEENESCGLFTSPVLCTSSVPNILCTQFILTPSGLIIPVHCRNFLIYPMSMYCSAGFQDGAQDILTFLFKGPWRTCIDKDLCCHKLMCTVVGCLCHFIFPPVDLSWTGATHLKAWNKWICITVWYSYFMNCYSKAADDYSM